MWTVDGEDAESAPSADAAEGENTPTFGYTPLPQPVSANTAGGIMHTTGNFGVYLMAQGALQRPLCYTDRHRSIMCLTGNIVLY